MSPICFATETAARRDWLVGAGLDAVLLTDPIAQPDRTLLVEGPPTDEMLARPGGVLRWISAEMSPAMTAEAVHEWFENDLRCIFLEETDGIAELLQLAEEAAAEPAARLARAELARHCDVSVQAGDLAGIATWDVDVPAAELSFPASARTLFNLPPGPNRVPIIEWMRLVHPEDRSSLWATINGNIRGDTPQHNIDYRIVLPDGQLQHLRVSGLVTAFDAFGRALRLSGTAFAVTALRQAEASVTREAQRLEALSWAAGEFIFEVNSEGTVTFVTPSVEAVLGWPAAELIGRPLADLMTERGADWRFNAGCSLEGTVVPMRHRDGHPIWLEVSAQPVEDECAAVIIGVARDVTAVQAARAELLAATAEAEASAKARAGFLAALSRDIRTPLNDILGLAELMVTDERSAPLEPRGRGQLETIRRTGEGLIQVLDDVLDLTKTERGALDVVKVPYSPAELCAEVTSLMAERAASRGICLLLEAKAGPADLPEAVIGDPSRLRQALLNLVGNAIKFTEQGEVIVRGEYDRAAQQLRISVKDTGVGISAEQQERLFLPFHQADPSVQRRYGGTGLGLAISLRIAEAQRGTIQLQSAVGVGSTFTLTWPAALSVEAPPLPQLTDQRALILSSSAPLRASLRALLDAAGAHVREATSPPQALSIMGGGAGINVVIIDLDEATRDASLLLRVLRASPSTAKVPVVGLTGSADQARLLAAQAVGLTTAVTKPARPLELLTTLSTLLNGAPSAPAPLAPTPAAPPRALRVLLVEDNPVNQEVARLQLERLGATVDVAADGVEALEALGRARYQLVLMDCQMPRMDGYTATRELRRRPEGAGLPVVALTANAMLGDRERCLQSGMDDYLSKPVRQSDLAGVISRWVKPDEAGST